MSGLGWNEEYLPKKCEKAQVICKRSNLLLLLPGEKGGSVDFLQISIFISSIFRDKQIHLF